MRRQFTGPQDRRIAERRLYRSEHFDIEGWRPPLVAEIQKERHDFRRVFLLVRLKGFEPPTFWFVVAAFAFYIVWNLLENADISTVSRNWYIVVFYNFLYLFVLLCAKCAPKIGRTIPGFFFSSKWRKRFLKLAESHIYSIVDNFYSFLFAALMLSYVLYDT